MTARRRLFCASVADCACCSVPQANIPTQLEYLNVSRVLPVRLVDRSTQLNAHYVEQVPSLAKTDFPSVLVVLQVASTMCPTRLLVSAVLLVITSVVTVLLSVSTASLVNIKAVLVNRVVSTVQLERSR